MNEQSRRAAVVGTGLIGGSIGLGLRRAGWHVTGTDANSAAAHRAVELGAIDEIGADPAAEITFVATPVGAVVGEVKLALARGRGVVTDVGSVKAPIGAAVRDQRFVPGHPMAGSEQEGVEGADENLFQGAVWVLTASEHTDDAAYAKVHSAVTSLGADVVTMPAERHDALVAMVSHVPHLTAATLMKLADERAVEHAALLRLAAGGFRDMTRIAAGHPGIWPDICGENRAAIVDVLGRLIDALGDVRAIVAENDREALLEVLETARAARTNLPTTAAKPEDLAELRIQVPDRPGELAAITTTATDLTVNIYDMEIAHSSEGPRGVVIIVVDADKARSFRDVLAGDGYHVSVRSLS